MPNDESSPAVTPSSSPVTQNHDHAGRPRWLTTALVGVAALLIGVGAGLAIGTAKDSDDGHHGHAGANATAVGFAQDMIVHHQQAVEMTRVVIERGSDARVRDLAVTMLSDQSAEIGQMTGWLQSWGAPLSNPGAPMSWMHHGSGSDHCADGHVDEHCPAPGNGGHDHGSDHGGDHHGATMPAPVSDDPPMDGMATKAEMARLRSLSGAAVDTYFLQLMLRHHQGGHHMMEMVVDHKNGAPEYVRALADKMNAAQVSEEATMKQLLAQRNAAPLP